MEKPKQRFAASLVLFLCSAIVLSRPHGHTFGTTSVMASSNAKFVHQKIVAQDAFRYAMRVGFRESDAAKELRLATAPHEQAIMMADPIESSLFGLLLPSMGAKKVIEVGVFTGYTTLVMAESLPSDGKVLALDVTREYVKEEYWKDVQHKIDFRLGPAKETLEALCQKEGELNSYDFAFIDADKVGYIDYYELLYKLIRPNGIIAIDNVFRDGRVYDETNDEEITVALRKISEHVQNDDRVTHVLLPFADGVTLVRKK